MIIVNIGNKMIIFFLYICCWIYIHICWNGDAAVLVPSCYAGSAAGEFSLCCTLATLLYKTQFKIQLQHEPIHINVK